MKKKPQIVFWTALLWSVTIFILLIIPGQEFSGAPRVPFLDKIIHIFLFGIQVLLWCRYIDLSRTPPVLRNFLLVFFISCLFGIAMEFVQKYGVANRSFETEDIVADIIGSAMGWLIYRYFFFEQEKVV